VGSSSGTGGTSGTSGAEGSSGGSTGASSGISPSGGCFGTTPLLYDAATDRLPHPAAPPTLGAAGTVVNDPIYGTPMLRLTDANTLPGQNESFQVANEFWGNDWNTDETIFYVASSNGEKLYYSFDPTAFTASRVMSLSSPTTPLAVPVSNGGFSRQDPNILYGLAGGSIAQYDFTTQTSTAIVALATLVPDAGGNALGVQEAADGTLVASFGGPEQDEMPYVATWNPATGTAHVLDVTASTLDGVPLTVTIGGGVNTFQMDKSGQCVLINVGGTGSGDWLWNLTAGTVEANPHTGTVGSGAWIATGSGGAYLWDLVQLAAPATETPIVTPVPAPPVSLVSTALDWENAVPGALAPLIVETMRQPADDGGWDTWDDELIAVRTDGVLTTPDGGAPQTEVWRFAHNFNQYQGTIYSDAFYYLYKPRVSQNGWFVTIDSNWNQGLGMTDAGVARTDVFIVALPNGCGP
jgi:hypothetical protein